MTQEGMRHLAPRNEASLPLTYGYLISQKGDKVYILEDNKKSIVGYHRDFWKAYHAEENF